MNYGRARRPLIAVIQLNRPYAGNLVHVSNAPAQIIPSVFLSVDVHL
jgi:hypothetical protein